MGPFQTDRGIGEGGGMLSGEWWAGGGGLALEACWGLHNGWVGGMERMRRG